MKILLLEDNQTDAGLTLRALKKNLPDCEVEHVTSLQEARESLCKLNNFDIALLDMELPDGNGMNILMEIRQKQIDMAVAMLTGSGDEEVATAALKAGADDYMVKQPGYVSKIPQLVEFAITNHKSIQRRDSNLIRVLYIEHNAADVDLTSHYLTRYAPYIQIKNVSTGEEALKLLPDKETDTERCEFQVILMDYRLPGMTALEIIKEIRQVRKLDVPIIIVTGHGNEEVAVQALKIGASDYLVKRENYLTRLPSLISGSFEHLELERKQKALAESESKYRLLAETAFDLVNFTSTQKLYEYTARKLFELMKENGIVALVEFDTGNNRWKMQHIEGIHNKLDALAKITGFNVKNLEGSISTKYFEKLLSGKLEEIEWDFLGFFNNKVSGKIGKAVKILLSIDKIYCILIQKSEQVFGNITLVTKKNTKPLNVELIEAFALQVTNFIKKLKSEEALSESEAKYRLLAENSDDVIFTLDFDLNYTYISPAVYALRGYRPEEIINRNLSETLTPVSGKKVKQLFDKYISAIKSGNAFAEPLILELEVLKKEGSTIWVEVKLSVLTDSKGKPTGILGVSRDISKRKAAQDELRKLSRAVTQSPNSIIITDRDGNIEYVNPKFTQLTGFEKEEVLGKNPRILNSGEHPKSYYEELWNTILAENDWYGEFRNKKKSEELYWESASISPLVDDYGETTHFVAVKEDITERKKFIQDLQIAKEKAEESDRLKSAFLANMSHEIRTPMNGILGFTGLLLKPDLTSDQKEAYINIVHQSGQRMLNTVNDIVEISKIEAGIVLVNEKKTEVNKSVAELIRFFKPEAEKKGLKLFLDKLLPITENIITTDQNKLDSILSNLIKNAIKYTLHGEIKIGCKVKKNNLEFYVKDTGIGIPNNRQQAIFNRFEQADIEDTHNFEGSGLGLSIAKAYVEMLGGKIWVESIEGKGSTFYFSLPLNKQAKEKTKEKETRKQNNKTTQIKDLNIIIAEDDDTSALFLQTILKKDSNKILLTKNGHETVEICRNNPDIDLILMDIQMPEMNGYEATSKIRKFNKKVMIIAQTAFALAGDYEKAMEAGCNDYISKPINKEVLLHKIGKLKFE